MIKKRGGKERVFMMFLLVIFVLGCVAVGYASSASEVFKVIGIESQINVLNEITSIETGEKTFQVEVLPNSGPVNKIIFNEVKANSNLGISLDDTPEDIEAHIGKWEEVYAIDPTRINFSYATVFATAKGTKLYKCKQWDFNNRVCNGDWNFFVHLTPGQEYSFTLTPEDPAFGEIIAIDAEHLDMNYNFISNIYEQVKGTDGIWSEPIRVGEFVRTTFEENLSDGNVIDVYAKGSTSDLYFEVYEKGTLNKVGRSSFIESADLQYITVSGLSSPTQTLDLKILRRLPGGTEISDCKITCLMRCIDSEDYTECENECNDSCAFDYSVNAYVEFDLIHDAPINATGADGFVAYSEAAAGDIKYRLWNNTGVNFSAQFNNANNTGAPANWIVTKSSHERDEVLVGTLDTGAHLYVQVYQDGRMNQTHLLNLSVTLVSAVYRAFDIAYEDISGDALIVYENDSQDDFQVHYRIWNGTGFSAKQNFTMGLANAGNINFAILVSKKASDEMMLVVSTDAATDNLYAVPWDGDGFNATKGIVLTAAPASVVQLNFDFAWEESTGNGLVAYPVGNTVVNSQYNGTGWKTIVSSNVGNALNGVRLCSSPNSAFIGMIVQDQGSDVNAWMWNGTNLSASPPTQDPLVETLGSRAPNFDCIWRNETHAFFGYVDQNELRATFINFTKPNTWTPNDFTNGFKTPIFASDDIQVMRFTKHPITTEFMILAMDLVEDLTMQRYNGFNFSNPTPTILEPNTAVSNGQNEGAMFDWFIYDTKPNITINEPLTNSLYNLSFKNVNISVNVTDNIQVDTVIAMIKFPNNSYFNLTLNNITLNNYKSTFNHTNTTGSYTITIFANDTSTHRNINMSEFIIFNVTHSDIIPPTITDLRPNGSTYSLGEIFEIAANVTDTTGVSNVSANVTYPNGAIVKYNLTNLTYGNRFNTTFSGFNQLGRYNITFYANDTLNNLNNSEKTNFTIIDTTPPNVTALVPINNMIYNISQTIEIATNVTDNYFLKNVILSIKFPNGTINNYTLVNITYTNKFNYSFTTPKLPGLFNVTIYANDSSGNLNNSEKTNFTVIDPFAPYVEIISPIAGSNYLQNDNVSIVVNVSDAVNISFVYANITFPDFSAIQINLTDYNADGFYNDTLNVTSQVGIYEIRIFANDSSNNLNNSEVNNFSIQDAGIPFVMLITPETGKFFDKNNISVFCNATDNSALNNITLYHNISQTFGINATKEVDGIYNESNFTLNGIPDGRYIWNCLARDTSNNIGFGGNNFTFIVDTIFPAVSGTKPAINSQYNVSQEIEIACNATDLNGISNGYVNFIYPNGTSTNYTLVRYDTTEKYNISFTAPALMGLYNVTFYVNDTANNTNSSVKTNFSITDLVAPSVLAVLPINNSVYILSGTAQISANVTDNVLIDLVYANITLPNGTINNYTLINETYAEKFNYSFNLPLLAGLYNLTIYAIDFSGNLNDSERTNFTVTDIIFPNVTLSSPADYYNSSSRNIQFNFTPRDNYYATLNCSVIADGIVNLSNSSSLQGSINAITINNFYEGSHYWYVNCSDGSLNENSSVVRNFTIDVSPPSFLSFETFPVDEADLDPGVNVTVIANVTDATLNVSTVILGYKLSAASVYTNITMIYDDGVGSYNATFNASASGTYNLILFANDTIANYNFSVVINRSVLLDKTWSTLPVAALLPVTANLYDNITLGNLTINNTGDVGLNFTITSNYNTTTYNDTNNFTLAAHTYKKNVINETASVAGVKSITLDITTDSGAVPSSKQITGSIIVAPNQPILLVEFTEPTTEEYSVIQGQSVSIEAKVTNIGSGNATDVNLTFTLPAGFQTLSSNYKIIGDLLSGDENSYQILITIPSDYATGSYYLYANASGLNESGARVEDSNLTYPDLIQFNVNPSPQLLSGGGGVAPGEISLFPGAVSSAGGISGGAVTRIGEPIVLRTVDVIENVRGNLKEGVPVTITNSYANAIIEDINFEVQGIFSQYVTIEQQINPKEEVFVETKSFYLFGDGKANDVVLSDMENHTLIVNKVSRNTANITFKSNPVSMILNNGEKKRIDLNEDGRADIVVELVEIRGNEAYIKVHKVGTPDSNRIYSGESRNFTMKVFAPPYLQQDVLEITIKINANLTAVNPELANFTWRPLIEYRKLMLFIYEVTKEYAEARIVNATNDVNSMEYAGFPVNIATQILIETKNALEAKSYDVVVLGAEKIAIMKFESFEADRIIKLVKETITKANNRWVKTEGSNRLIDLAIKAFAREDFATSLTRAQEAQVKIIEEAGGKYNLWWILAYFWWAIIIGSALLALLLFAAYKKFMVFIIKLRMSNLDKEESTIYNLKKSTQNKYLKGHNMSVTEYGQIMQEYDKRLIRIAQRRIKLMNLRIGLMKKEQQLENLNNEEKDVLKNIKHIQEQYFKTSTITRGQFWEIYKANSEKLAEISGREERIKEILGQEKKSKIYKFLKFVDNLFFKKKNEVKNAKK